jgi:FKBP-type peptidyl-prolyl cis-trans isomerase FkpA
VDRPSGRGAGMEVKAQELRAPYAKRSIATFLFVFSLLLGACGDDGGGEPEASPPAEGESCNTEPVTTDSGLVIEDLECGEGEPAMRGDTVVVHYRGSFEDGEEFESSYGGEPFPVTIGSGMVIPGWEEGLVGMTEGGIRKLTIPPELAYGATGQGPIPPNATLVFEIEVLELHPAEG